MAYGLSNAVLSNMTNVVKEITTTPVNPDNATGQDETIYQNTKWSKQYGTFLEADDFQQALVMQSIWTVGKGYETEDIETGIILDRISGCGKETFLDVMFTQNMVSKLAGDSYAEIIRDEKKKLINLKPIDPATMKIVYDKKGIIKCYRQVTNVPNGKEIEFKPDEIFHLCNLRFGIHGTSVLESLQKIIDADKESFTDLKKIMHRQARPIIIFKVGTDNPSEIETFKNKMDNACNLGENIYIPNDEKTVDYKPVEININSMLLSWREHLNNKFFRALGMPISIFGGAAGNESQSKISYLAHETVFKRNSLYLEQQIWNQLYLKVKFISPATLLDNLQTDENKDANQGMEIQASDVTAGSGA